ncbi:MAG: asparagine synthase (glutamine-hydrolyzing) [Polyangiaceae bacterium]|nr:asparagine synthase (glutamine-hydrolyzing) [Polyangiaceae bacterium]MCB9605810.1 asparagine synthase (glutamine-hydrolyzing) [Polyangiaceae bacterium]
MCGIAGILSLKADLPPTPIEVLSRMAATIEHRGPDEFGVYRDARIGLAHSRLSIIDLATGQQPLSDVDERFWLVFNGEIFNYVELRAELVALGHRFRTKSDTEVIVAAFKQWGRAAFSRFNGQFAIALWDPAKQELTLARDWSGIRPLYYMEHKGRLYFSSEVKAIFAASDELPRAFDAEGLEETFTFWSSVPPQGVFAGVRDLPPGRVRTYSASGVEEQAAFEHAYPRSRDEEFRGSLDDAVVAVRDALNEATRLRMLRADVPVGSYLSGGLDSSLVAAMGKRAKGEGFQTFSLRFEDAEYDETEFQRMMVNHIQSEHHELVVSRKSIAEVFPQVIYHAERPVLRTAPAPLFMLSGLVRQHGIKVVLTGEGADEVFAGYDIFREAKVRRFWAKNAASDCRPRLLERLYPYLARSPVSQQAMARKFFGRNLEGFAKPGFSHDMRWQGTAALKRMFTPAIKQAVGELDVEQRLLADLPADFSKWSYLAQDQYLEMRTLLAGYLLCSQGDRMLMGNSVEGRFPFLDINVARLAASLPASYKLKVLDEKHVVKRASEGVIPGEILSRKKQPYRAPDALAFVGEGAEWAEELVSEEAIKASGVFEPSAVTRLWAKCKARAATQFSNTDNMAVVGVLSTQLLHQRFIQSAPKPRAEIQLGTLVDKLS